MYAATPPLTAACRGPASAKLVAAGPQIVEDKENCEGLAPFKCTAYTLALCIACKAAGLAASNKAGKPRCSHEASSAYTFCLQSCLLGHRQALPFYQPQ